MKKMENNIKDIMNKHNKEDHSVESQSNKITGIKGQVTKIGRSEELILKLNKVPQAPFRILALIEAVFLRSKVRAKTSNRLAKDGFSSCLSILDEALKVFMRSTEEVKPEDTKAGLQIAFKALAILIEALRFELDEEKSGVRIAPPFGGNNDKRSY